VLCGISEGRRRQRNDASAFINDIEFDGLRRKRGLVKIIGE